VVAKVLLHSGVDDDARTDKGLLVREFEAANAKYEIARYGNDVFQLHRVECQFPRASHL
jgi:hypothetical protein